MAAVAPCLVRGLVDGIVAARVAAEGSVAEVWLSVSQPRFAADAAVAELQLSWYGAMDKVVAVMVPSKTASIPAECRPNACGGDCGCRHNAGFSHRAVGREGPGEQTVLGHLPMTCHTAMYGQPGPGCHLALWAKISTPLAAFTILCRDYLDAVQRCSAPILLSKSETLGMRISSRGYLASPQQPTCCLLACHGHSLVHVGSQGLLTNATMLQSTPQPYVEVKAAS
eukprot:363237-Chlamydomonas_euryale.AAC.1